MNLLTKPSNGTSKLRIFLHHFLFFVLGSITISIYIFYNLASPANEAGLGGVIVMPAVILIYIVSFGILCTVSFFVWLLVAYFRNHDKNPTENE